MKQHSASSLHKYCKRWTKLLTEFNKLSTKPDATGDQRAQGEIEARMSVICTSLLKVEASITKYEDRLEGSQIQEEEACYGEQGWSNSHKDADDDVQMEIPRESSPPGMESPSHLRHQEAEPPTEADTEGTLSLASGGNITVSPKEDDLLSRDLPDTSPKSNTTSMAGELARLQVIKSLRVVRPHNRSHLLLNMLLRYSAWVLCIASREERWKKTLMLEVWKKSRVRPRGEITLYYYHY